MIPVDVIVTALVSGLRPVRDLFPEIALRGEDLTDQVVGVGRGVFIGMTARVAPERSRGLGGEGVATDVRRRISLGSGGRSSVARTSSRPSAREPTMRSMFQVENPAVGDGLTDLAVRHGAVATSEVGEDGRLGRLHAETHARDTAVGGRPSIVRGWRLRGCTRPSLRRQSVRGMASRMRSSSSAAKARRRAAAKEDRRRHG